MNIKRFSWRSQAAITAVLSVLSLLVLAGCAPATSPLTASPPTEMATEAPSSTPTAVPTLNEPSPTASATTQIINEPGDYYQTITSEGAERLYILHVPTGYDDSTAYPLVFVLHGFGGTALGMTRETGLSDKADEAHFIVAYLNGTGSQQGWNSGLMSDSTSPPDDVAFVRAVTEQIEGLLNVDKQRIYAAGFSNGGIMSHRLGAYLSDVLAGVAIVAGAIGVTHEDGSLEMIPDPIGPIPVMIIHGKNDTVVLYEGGSAGIDALSVTDAVTFWTTADQCLDTPEEQTSADGNVISTDYQGCAAGSEVMLYTIISGAHEWPKLTNRAHFSGTDAIWEFFSRHAKQ
jgi:polyhydroxybutyrate depolymerase